MKEQDLVNAIAREALNEQRRNRRWGIFFKLFFAGYALLLLFVYLSDWQGDATMIGSNEHTALININGVISSETTANADSIIASLRNAFEHKGTMGVVMQINSPGGSPVQAGYIHNEIKRLRKQYPEIPVYTVITDVCASGGYYIAVAADEIYANKASVVGSIGVVMPGFGFVEAIEKLGIERRILYAGENKPFMDPFLPLKPAVVSHVNKLLDEVHQQFKEVVQQGRGERLQANQDIFSGFIWSGEQSLSLGLVDGMGSADYVAREIIGHAKIVNFTRHKDYLDQFVRKLGGSIVNALGLAGGYQLQL